MTSRQDTLPVSVGARRASARLLLAVLYPLRWWASETERAPCERFARDWPEAYAEAQALRRCHYCDLPIPDDEKAIEAMTKNGWAHFECWYDGRVL